MDRQRMMIQVVQHGTQAGLLTGAKVGAGYGVAVPLAVLLLTLLQAPTLDSLPSGIVVLLYTTIIGLVVGLVVGSAAGLLLGILNGVAAALLTVTLYSPMHDPDQYHWSVRLVSVLVTLLAIGTATIVSGYLPYGNLVGLVLVGIPLLLTLPCAWLSSSHLARWYLALSDKVV